MEDQWALRIENTFITVGPQRSPSLDRFYQERQERSCPCTPTHTSASLTEADVAEVVTKLKGDVVAKLEPNSNPIETVPFAGKCCSCFEFGCSHDNFLACAICCMEPTATTSAASDPESSDNELQAVDDITFDSVFKNIAQKHFDEEFHLFHPNQIDVVDLDCESRRLPDGDSARLQSVAKQHAKSVTHGDNFLNVYGSVLRDSSSIACKNKCEGLGRPWYHLRSKPFFQLPKGIILASTCVCIVCIVYALLLRLIPQPSNIEISHGNETVVHDSRMPMFEGTVSESQLSLNALQKSLADVKELFGRLDELQPLLTSESMRRDYQRLHSLFADLVQKVKAASSEGKDMLLAAQDAQLHDYHQELMLFVERVRGKNSFSVHEEVSRSSGLPVAFRGKDEIDVTTTARPPLSASFGRFATVESPLQIHAQKMRLPHYRPASAESPTTTTSTGGVVELEFRMHSAFRSIVSSNKRYESLQVPIRRLPADLSAEIFRRGQQFDEALLRLQQLGSNVEFATDGGIAMHGYGGQKRADVVYQYWQYVTDLEAFVKAQTVFLADVERVLR